jgi:DNA-binding NtrC family response regulator
VKQILLVEDQNAFIAETILEAHGGVKVTTARRGDLGLESFKASPFDGVILDLRLPVLDGFAVLEAIKRLEPSMPVIVLSSYGDAKTRERATRLGADAYFSKPPDYLKVHSKLMSLIAQREARQTVTLQVSHSEKLARARRLLKLKEQAARMGISTPPEVLIEIEDLEKALE